MWKWMLLLSGWMSFNSIAGENLALLDEASPWKSKLFVGETQYDRTVHKDKEALRASSKQSASGLFLQRRIDLNDTPYLNWSWLVETPLPPLNEATKEGDDYAARIYVVIGNPIFMWSTKTLTYVWSSSQPKGEFWDNAYTGPRVKMIAVRGDGDPIGQWHNERRNVYQDLITHFGDLGSEQENLQAYRYIDIIAIMTDTDDSAGFSEAYYGNISFGRRM